MKLDHEEFCTWYMPEKINKMPKFYMIFARKIFFPIFGGGASAPPAPPTHVSYAYEQRGRR